MEEKNGKNKKTEKNGEISFLLDLDSDTPVRNPKSQYADLEENEMLNLVAGNNSKRHIIKVIGVGGGGGNAVNNMYRENIKDVDFVVCNTDLQALNQSPVPIKIQLGAELTSGLGAGNDPKTGRDAARESIEEIKEVLENNTKMIFITAGMGGGTGTGAAPVIAQIAKEMNILTVAIVTLPFRFEGPKRLNQAVGGIKELQKNVDALLLIDNERIKQVYGDVPANEAFKKADQVLTIAAKGIADIINREGIINVDFADVHNILKDSGIAIMGTGYGEGENRAVEATKIAIHSPLLNFLNIKGAEKLLFNIAYNPEDDLITNEIEKITDYIHKETGNIPDTIWGYSLDPRIEKGKIGVTIIATGFNANIEDYLDSLLSQFRPKNLQPDKDKEKGKEKVKKEEKKRPEPDLITSPFNEKKESALKLKRKILEINSLKAIEELENQPALKRYGFTLDTEINEKDNSKFIRVIQK